MSVERIDYQYEEEYQEALAIEEAQAKKEADRAEAERYYADKSLG